MMFVKFWERKRGTMLKTGEQAPDFSLPSLAGGRLTLSEALQKGPALAAFFKVSCGTCQFTFPFLERLYRAYGNGALAFWAVSQDDAAKTQEFCQRFGVTFPAALDYPDYKASRSYAFSIVPTLFLIDTSGKIRFSLDGFSKAGLSQLSEQIAGLLGRPAKPLFSPGEQVPDIKPG
jgi:peroxiredoxin